MSGSSDSEALDEEEGNQGVTGSSGAQGYCSIQGYGGTQGYQWAQGNGSAAGYGGFQCYSNAPGYGGVPGYDGAHGYESTLESQAAQRYDGAPGFDEGPTGLLDFYNENPKEEAQIQAKHNQEGKGHPEKKPRGRAAANKKKAAQAADGKQDNKNNHRDSSKNPNKIPNQGGGSGTGPKKRPSSSKQSSCATKTSKTIRECSKTEQQDLKQAVDVKTEVSGFDVKTVSEDSLRQSLQQLLRQFRWLEQWSKQQQQQLEVNHQIEELKRKVAALQNTKDITDACWLQADSLLLPPAHQSPEPLPTASPYVRPQPVLLSSPVPSSSQPYPGYRPTGNQSAVSTPPYQPANATNTYSTACVTALSTQPNIDVAAYSSGGVSLSDTSDLIAGGQMKNNLLSTLTADLSPNDDPILNDFIDEHLNSTDGLDPYEMNQFLVKPEWGAPTAQFEAEMVSDSGQTSGGDHSYEGQ